MDARTGLSRLAASNLYFAAAAFLKAAELVCYGYQYPHSDLRALYVRTARFSVELSELFGFPDRFDRKFFYRMEAFRRNASTSTRFVFHTETYLGLQEKVERMEGIVRNLCGEWLKRLDTIRYGSAAQVCESAKVSENIQVTGKSAPLETIPDAEAAVWGISSDNDRNPEGTAIDGDPNTI